MPRRVVITGRRFGRLIALEPVNINKIDIRALWRCRCDCGNIKITSGECLQKGSTRSCGCIRGTHGFTRNGKMHPLYWAWKTMRSRCNNPNVKEYQIYGARGIKVCKRWEDFAKFLADVGERPPGHTLDRIDNDKGYFPSNVRWATPSTQMKNRRPYHHTKPNHAWKKRQRRANGQFGH